MSGTHLCKGHKNLCDKELAFGITNAPLTSTFSRYGVVVLPMRWLTELAQEGVVRQPAARHYSIMGYILELEALVGKTAPAIAERMRADGVDAAALAPV